MVVRAIRETVIGAEIPVFVRVCVPLKLTLFGCVLMAARNSLVSTL